LCLSTKHIFVNFGEGAIARISPRLPIRRQGADAGTHSTLCLYMLVV